MNQPDQLYEPTGNPSESKPPRFLKFPALHHAVAFLLFAAGLYFTIWLLITNEGLWRRPAFGVFRHLFDPYMISGGSMNWRMLGWSAGAVGIFALLGWFFLESLELYLPRAAAAALALLTGMGLAGFAFELIAMAHLFTRRGVFATLGVLLAILWPLAVWSVKRRPEAWSGGEGGAVEQTMRRKLARERYAKALVGPRGFWPRLFTVIASGLIAIISFLIFYHALLFPETYWDSLILYLGYARMMYIEHGIVEKVVGQVGIGLGANYPHLYSLLGAGISLAAREWSELPQRLIAPLCGLGSTVLVYHIVLRLTRHVNFSLAVTLLYRAVPLGIAYDQYASDYALSILFAAGVLYVGLVYIETGLSGYFILATALIAFAMHLNYLMGIFWLPWALMIWAAHVGMPTVSETADAERIEEHLRGGVSTAITGWNEPEEAEPAWTRHLFRPRLMEFIRSPLFLVTLGSSVAVGSIWYLRNWIVTGNPVYAFFNNFFPGKHVAPEVMESAAKEWGTNGWGIGRMGDDLTARVRGTWDFLMEPGHTYQIQPFVSGFAAMGVFILLARGIAGRWEKPKLRPGVEGAEQLAKMRIVDFGWRFGLIALALSCALAAFHYALAPYYLYQIVMILPALAVLTSFAFPYWRLPFWRGAFGALVILIGLVPGVAMALMGFKLLKIVDGGGGRMEGQLQLFALRHPLPEPDLFLHWQYGADADMWNYLNLHLRGQRILTHENRHLVLHPSIELVHLDDWVMQRIWLLPPEEQIRDLKRLDVHYYLFVPNEKNHPINARMKTDEWIKRKLVELVHEAGENRLYRIR